MTSYQWQSDKLYCALVHKVIQSEGRYSNDPDDKGGPTMWGIAYNFNVAAVREFGIFKPEDIINLTQDQARQIYYYKYWLGSGCDKIADKKLCYMHFDTAVNCGVGAAAKIMFKLSPNPKHYEAGGKNKGLWLKLFTQYRDYKKAYYESCDTYWKHGKGWLNRLARVYRDGLAMG